ITRVEAAFMGGVLAGETAARTAPITAASARVIWSIAWAKSRNTRISQVAGTQDRRIAGLPTFFKSDKYRVSQTLIRKIIMAICLRSEEMERMELSRRLSRYGPRRIPVKSIPMILGRCSLWQTPAINSPARKMKASEVNIWILLRF